jgi:hypothetical protein
MSANRPFEIIYDSETVQHLAVIERKHYSLIRTTIAEQLSYNPNIETRNRKPLTRPSVFGTAWELRFGPNNRFRVLYRMFVEIREIHILAIGVKTGNHLFIGGEEFEL